MFLRISSAKNLFHRWPLKRVAKDGNNVSAKLTSAFAEFRAHCRMLRESPLVKRFTRENLGWGSTKTYPKCSFKGSDTRLILGFLIGVLEKPEVQLDEVTSVAYVAAKSMDDFCDWCLGQKMVKDAESLCSIGTKVHMPWLCSQCGVKNFTPVPLCALESGYVFFR